MVRILLNWGVGIFLLYMVFYKGASKFFLLGLMPTLVYLIFKYTPLSHFISIGTQSIIENITSGVVAVMLIKYLLFDTKNSEHKE